MSSSSRQYIHLRSASGPVEISILDKNMNEVANGIEEVRQRVDPGLYAIRVDTGTTQEEQFIAVKPGENFELNVSPVIHSAAPLIGTSNFNPQQEEFVANLSRASAGTDEAAGRILLFVRKGRGPVDGGSEEEDSTPIDLSNLSLIGADSEVWRPLNDHVVRAEDGESAGVSFDTRPGGYRLRWHDKWHSRWNVDFDKPESVDLSIWVQPGWITAIFLSANPSIGQKPRMSGMSIQMRPRLYGFERRNAEIEARGNQANQLAINGLHSANPFVPDDIVELISNSDFDNPMLGILAAHSLLMANNPRWALFDQLVVYLTRTIPGHPDVVALRILGKELRNESSQTRTAGIEWPPMLYAGYRGLIDRDWHEGGLIASGSLAEVAVQRLIPQGPWTVWASEADENEDQQATNVTSPEVTEISNEILQKLGLEIRPAMRKLLETDSSGESWQQTQQMEAHIIPQVLDIVQQSKSEDASINAIKAISKLKTSGMLVSSVVSALLKMGGPDESI